MPRAGLSLRLLETKGPKVFLFKEANLNNILWKMCQLPFLRITMFSEDFLRPCFGELKIHFLIDDEMT